MLKRLVDRLVGWHAGRRRLGSRAVHGVAQRYHYAYMNAENYDCARNGEFVVLDRLAPFGFRVVFDVGANMGLWTAGVLARLPQAHVHAFEIAPPTAAALAERFAGNPRVTVNAAGLSDRPGPVEIRYFPSHPTFTRIDADARTPGWDWELVAAELDTGADYVERHGLAVDFLKVDCEGHDLMALRGFGALLQRIPVIQFEFNGASLDAGVTLKTFFDLLPHHRIGRLLPHGVEFKSYKAWGPSGLPGNFIAVLEQRAELIEALRCIR